MAKGNDGNFLQHSIEVAIAWHLVTRIAGSRLHIALAHGMAPYEACGPLPPGQTRALLAAALESARHAPRDGEPPIVSAYRATQASLDRYPNTGELLAGIIGRDRLCGGITEASADKHAELQEKWAQSYVTSVAASWRSEVQPHGVLRCPASLQSPWLFSADPMTYHDEGNADDDQLYRADTELLADVLTDFIGSGQPGVAALFVYAVRPESRPKFWRFTDDLAATICVSLQNHRLPLGIGRHSPKALFPSIVENQRDRFCQASAGFFLRPPLPISARNLGRVRCNRQRATNAVVSRETVSATASDSFEERRSVGT